MPAKRKANAEDDHLDFVDDEDDQEYEDAHAKKKSNVPKKDKGAGAGAGADKDAKKKKPAKPKPEVGPKPEGWDVLGDADGCPEGSVIAFRGSANEGCAKIAAFDFDGTLVHTKGDLPYPKDENDWRVYNNSSKEKIHELIADGYRIVIFTNQGAIKKAVNGRMAEKVTHRINNALKHYDLLDKGVCVLCACQSDQYRKPETGMFTLFEKHLNHGVQVDRDSSTFVGDADGSNPALGDTDRAFGDSLCLPFQSAEEFFGPPTELLEYYASGDGAGAAGTGGPNAGIVQMFRELANLTSLTQDDKKGFKVSAYRKAADAIEGYATTIVDTKESLKEVKKLPGVGQASLDKISEFLSTGSLAKIAELRTEVGMA